MPRRMGINPENEQSITDRVREEVARKHRISGISSGLEVELTTNEGFPTPDLAEKIITENYDREQHPTDTPTGGVDSLDR